MQDAAAALAELNIPFSYGVAAAIFAGLVLAMMLWLMQTRRNSRAFSGVQRLVEPAERAQGAPPQKPAVQFRDEATIVAEISTAKKSGDEAALAPLRLENGRRLAFEDNNRKATDELVQSVVLAKSNGLREVHAEARLELAALSEARGDLTTACEHWQIARMIYHELGQDADVDRTDANMLRNRCPTDWVLTDF